MAIVSYGYPTTLPPGAAYAKWTALVGRNYVVDGPGDLKVTAKTSETRTVQVANGWALGKGVADNLTAGPTLVAPLPAPPAAGSVYHLIVLRRTWGSVNETTLVAIPGTGTRAIPSRNTDPGAVDDQPLALVKITSGNNAPTEIVDLRAVAEDSGQYIIYDDLALNYLTRVGIQVYNANSGLTRTRIVKPNGDLAWQTADHHKLDALVAGPGQSTRISPVGKNSYLDLGTNDRLTWTRQDGTQTFSVNENGLITKGQLPHESITNPVRVMNTGITAARGWATGPNHTGLNNYLVKQGSVTMIRAYFRRTGGSLIPSSSGHLSNQTIATITDPTYKPNYANNNMAARYVPRGGSNADYTAGAYINHGGVLVLYYLAPGIRINKAKAGEWSISVQAMYFGVNF